jgi:hypothetical protein
LDAYVFDHTPSTNVGYDSSVGFPALFFTQLCFPPVLQMSSPSSSYKSDVKCGRESLTKNAHGLAMAKVVEKAKVKNIFD